MLQKGIREGVVCFVRLVLGGDAAKGGAHDVVAAPFVAQQLAPAAGPPPITSMFGQGAGTGARDYHHAVPAPVGSVQGQAQVAHHPHVGLGQGFD